MKIISSKTLENAVAKLCQSANVHLPGEVFRTIKKASALERSETGKDIFRTILENARVAAEQRLPICQDCGMAVFFVTLGQDVRIEGDTLEDAINKGVAKGYREGFLRKSIVKDPLFRENTNDNTPAVIHISTAPGDRLALTFAPKGFGSENMGGVKMLKPAEGEKGVRDFVVQTVTRAGGNPCPPVFVGVGIGGTMEKAAILAKKALLAPAETSNPDPFYAKMEAELLEEINKSGIGPQGLGGDVTALSVKILTFPTHIAGLPVAVNICCHALRHETVTL